ncbi:MAG: LURP-one-related family protein, partial [Gemmatimonadaceae bacterium]
MRYVLKQRLLALGKHFDVMDAAGNDLYVVASRVFSIGDRLSFRDLRGNELAEIRRRFFRWNRTWEVIRKSRPTITVQRQRLALFHHRFDIEIPAATQVTATGNFLDNEYEFERAAVTVASVSRRWFSIADTYGVDVAPGED